MLLYMALAPESKLSAPHCDSNALPCTPCPPLAYACPLARAAYKEGGPAAEARFEAGVAGFEARSFRGCGVFTSEPFEVSDDADSVQMLTRSSQIGEFYVMSPPQVYPGDGKGQFTCDMMIFDEESDRHVRIQWKDALKACLIASGNAAYAVAAGTPGINGDTDMLGAPDGSNQVKDWKAKADLWAAYSEKGGTQAEYEGAAANGGLDVRIVVARPFIEHLMHNAILTVAGRDTGATLFGPADMQLSANTQVKTIEGARRARTHTRVRARHSACQPAAERSNRGAQDTTPDISRPLSPSPVCSTHPTTDPTRRSPACSLHAHLIAFLCAENVMVMRDVACAGYVAGCNARWFAKEGEDAGFTVKNAQTAIQDRLSFADDVTDRYASMLAFPAWEGQFEGGQLDTVMCALPVPPPCLRAC